MTILLYDVTWLSYWLLCDSLWFLFSFMMVFGLLALAFVFTYFNGHCRTAGGVL